ncbi:chitin-binding domain protein cbd-1-like isoform X2 [Glandiceps talaboti]
MDFSDVILPYLLLLWCCCRRTQAIGVTNIPVSEVYCSTARTDLYPRVHPTDCTRYINCGSGQEHVSPCPPGKVFNPRQRYCDWPENVPECDEIRSSTTNVRVTLGQTTKLTSASIPVSNSPLTNTPVSRVDCSTAPDSLYPFPADCTKYINCGSGLEHVSPCPPGKVFNPRQRYCDWPENVPECDEIRSSTTNVRVTLGQTAKLTSASIPVSNSPLTNTPVSRVDCSTAPDGLYPFPVDCTKYINCGSGLEHISPCQSGLLFNPRQLYCDWPRNVPECKATRSSSTTVKLEQSTTRIPVTHSPALALITPVITSGVTISIIIIIGASIGIIVVCRKKLHANKNGNVVIMTYGGGAGHQIHIEDPEVPENHQTNAELQDHLYEVPYDQQDSENDVEFETYDDIEVNEWPEAELCQVQTGVDYISVCLNSEWDDLEQSQCKDLADNTCHEEPHDQQNFGNEVEFEPYEALPLPESTEVEL